MINYIGSTAQYLMSATKVESDDGSRAENINYCKQAVKSLSNVIKGNPGIEVLCNGHFKLIFCLLRFNEDAEMQKLALEVIGNVTGNRACVGNIAESKVLVYLLLAIQNFPGGKRLCCFSFVRVSRTPHLMWAGWGIPWLCHNFGDPHAMRLPL